jgi:hypothetical protein
MQPNESRRWSVSFLVTDADSRHLSGSSLNYASQIEGVDFISVGPAGVTDADGLASLTFELQAPTLDAAKERARSIAGQMRKAAGCPPTVETLGWAAPLRGLENLRFLNIAEEMLDSEYPELAVVAAETHFESQLASILEHAAESIDNDRFRKWVHSARIATKPASDQAQATIELLLGIDVRQTPEWPEFKTHLLRRHGVVHQGAEIDRDQALASLQAVEALWRRLLRELD